MNPSLRRHPTLILLLTAVLAWPWSAALAISSASSETVGVSPSDTATPSNGHAGKPGRPERPHGGTLSPALDDSDDGDGVDSEALLHLIAADLACFPAPGPIVHTSDRAGMACPPSCRSSSPLFRLLC